MSSVLVRDGGIICGDDLEIQFDEIDLENASENKQKYFIIDSKTGFGFHPGVTLALYKYFGGKVSNFGGFWAMRKKG